MALPNLEDFLKPISPDAPAGEDLRYDPVTTQIREARRRDDLLNQGVWKREVKEADYKLVIKLCRDALTKRSKDLQIAAWFTEALIYQEGLPGLLFGLRLTRRLLEEFWDSVHPEIEDDDLEMRATPLNWIGSQLDAAVKSIPITRTGLDWIRYTESRTVPSEEEAGLDEQQQERRQDALQLGKVTPEEFERGFEETPYEFYRDLSAQIAEALSELEGLGAFCDEKFGDESPALGGLRGTLEEVQQVVRVLQVRKRDAEGIVEHAGPAGAEEEPEEEPSAPESVREPNLGPATETRRAPRPPRRAPSAEPADEQEAIDRVLAAAAYLRRANPYQPAGYLLTRALRWGELRAAGPQPDFSVLEAPPTETRLEIKRAMSEGQYDVALAAAEQAMGLPCGRAWLDLQRYSVACCQSLGYGDVEVAIKDSLRCLLAARPELPQWTLADDTPAANPETRAWLEQEGLLGSLTEPPSPAPRSFSYLPEPPPPPYPETAAEERPPDAADLAMEAARAGRVDEAVSLLWREAAQETSGRGRFLRLSQLARICLATQHRSVALPILEELVAEISERKLETWEGGELAGPVLAMYLRALEPSPETLELRRGLYARLCRVDPRQALEFGDAP